MARANAFHVHADLIEGLGGEVAVADKLSALMRKIGCDKEFTHQSVHFWKIRGIPMEHRGRVQHLLLLEGRRVPKNFLLM